MSTLHFMLKHECTIKNIYNSLTVFLNDFIHMHVFGNKQFLVTFIDNDFLYLNETLNRFIRIGFRDLDYLDYTLTALISYYYSHAVSLHLALLGNFC